MLTSMSFKSHMLTWQQVIWRINGRRVGRTTPTSTISSWMVPDSSYAKEHGTPSTGISFSSGTPLNSSNTKTQSSNLPTKSSNRTEPNSTLRSSTSTVTTNPDLTLPNSPPATTTPGFTNGYLSIAQMLAKHEAIFNFTCMQMKDWQQLLHASRSSEGLVC